MSTQTRTSRPGSLKADYVESLFVCRACLAALPEKNSEAHDGAKDDLFRMAGVQVSDFIPAGLCQQCKDVISLFKSFRIQVIKANAVFSDLVDKFQNGKSITPKLVIEERRKYILPRIVLKSKDGKPLEEQTDELTSSPPGMLAAIKSVESKNSDLKNLGVTFASNLVSDADAVVHSVHNVKMLRCADAGCNKTFTNVLMLKKHLSLEHLKGSSEVTGSFFCPVVDCRHSLASTGRKAFTNRNLLKQHYIKVHLQKMFACTKCEMKFPTVAMCSRHEKCCSLHITCTICNVKFLKQGSLISHTMRKHPRNYEEQLRQRKIARSREKLLDSKAVSATKCAVATETIPPANKVAISVNHYDPLSPARSEAVISDELIESVLGCRVKSPTSFAVFADQFTQTAIKTAPKQKTQANRTTAQTQTFECATYSKGTGFCTNVDMRTSTSFVEASTGQNQTDQIMVLDAQTSTSQITKRRRSVSDNPSPLLSYSSFDAASQSQTPVFERIPSTSNSTTIETQTALDELHYSNMHQEIDSNLFSELVSLSDIQTQTVWTDTDLYDDFGPMDILNCFDKRSLSSEMECEKNMTARSISPIPPSPTPMDILSNLTSSPDLTFKGTQTYFFFNDSPKQTNHLM